MYIADTIAETIKYNFTKDIGANLFVFAIYGLFAYVCFDILYTAGIEGTVSFIVMAGGTLLYMAGLLVGYLLLASPLLLLWGFILWAGESNNTDRSGTAIRRYYVVVGVDDNDNCINLNDTDIDTIWNKRTSEYYDIKTACKRLKVVKEYNKKTKAFKEVFLHTIKRKVELIDMM